jgi:hypothetical protein
MFNYWIFLDYIICHDSSIYFYIWYEIKRFIISKINLFYLGVASNLERKSRENARKMSSLVGKTNKRKTLYKKLKMPLIF